MNRYKEVLILGFALFAMFFGAGNLMFPPSLGVQMGEDWLVGGLGFLLTGVGLTLLGVLAFTRVGKFEDFSSKISPRFSRIYCTALVIVIGPLFAIPRTGSTTFEMGILPSFPNTDPLILSIISAILFFSITLLLVLRESRITDIIGKFLTPIILIILAAITFFGITGDIGTPVDKQITNSLSKGFVYGYQTMDALASVIFGVILIKCLEGKGIFDKKEQRFYLAAASVVAAAALGLIYMSLMYLGARVSGVENNATTAAILYIAQVTLGSAGKIAFGICVATACITTAVGLVAIAADWFARFTSISYRAWTVIICIFSAVLSIGGVDFIIKLSVPVLCILYPVTIILIVLNILGVTQRHIYKFATYTTLVVITLEVGADTFGLTPVTQLINTIPLAEEGFAWVTPCLIAIALGFLIKSKKAEKNA